MFKAVSSVAFVLLFIPLWTSAQTGNIISIGLVEVLNPKTNVIPDTTHDFKVFSTKNSRIRRDMMRAVSVDSNNVLWVGTDDGIVRIEDSTMSNYNYTNAPLKRRHGETTIMASAVDSRNRKWFTDGPNVYCYNDTVWTVYDSTNSTLSWVKEIYADTYGNVWFTSWKGLSKYDGTVWARIDTSNSSIPSNDIVGVFVDSKKRVWIGTHGGNIMIDGDSTTRFTDPKCPLATAMISQGYEDSKGNMWFSLYQRKYPRAIGFAGLSSSGVWTSLTTENSEIPRNDVLYTVYNERENLFWISINSVGICSYDGNKWTVNTFKNSKVPSSYSQTMVVDMKGIVWCATFNGLLRISPK